MNKKILLVDDEQRFSETLQQMLSDAGFDVKVASDGTEALVMLEQDRFDLMVTDLHMAPMGGLELLSIVGDQYSNLPIIVITADENLVKQVHKLSARVLDYLIKPIEIETLLGSIKAVEDKELTRV